MKSLRTLLRINPIIVKEIRSRMRGPRPFITLTMMLLVMGGLMYAVLQIILANSRYSTVLSPQVGQALFAVLAFMELFMICVITPAVTSGAISSEKEHLTYEMLMATPLSPTSILLGKLISALSYIILLLFAAVPLASVVFIFGGVAINEMLKALIVLIVIAISYGILGLFYSALFGRTGRATVASLVTVVVLMMGPIFLAGIVGVMRSSEPPRWILAPSPISALSSALAPAMGINGGSEIFWVLSGIFGMGVNTISQNGIPRPLYHFTLPFYLVLSLLLYMLATRLVQPARRWQVQRKQLLTGIAVLVVTVGLIVGAFLATTGRYEQVKNPNQAQQAMAEPVRAVPVGSNAEKEVQVVDPNSPTPTPGGKSNGAVVELTLDERAQIYAAVARQLYSVDHTFGENNPPNWEKLFLIRITDDKVGDPNVPEQDPVEVPEEVMNGVVKQMSDLPAQVIWVDSSFEVGKDPKSGVVENGKGVIITFGNIQLQEDGTAQVSASLFFSSLGATGKTYILTNEDGVWKITGTTGVEWIS